jgi:formate dehydrogenase subunit delta
VTPDKMIHMANQIASFMATQPGDGEVAGIGGVAHHIRQFWEPRMRDQLLAHVDAGGAGLDPMVIAAVARLRVTG